MGCDTLLGEVESVGGVKREGESCLRGDLGVRGDHSVHHLIDGVVSPLTEPVAVGGVARGGGVLDIMKLTHLFQFLTHELSPSVGLQELWWAKQFEPLEVDGVGYSVSFLTTDKPAELEASEAVNEVEDVGALSRISFIFFQVYTEHVIKIDSARQGHFGSRDPARLQLADFAAGQGVHSLLRLLAVAAGPDDDLPQVLLVDVAEEVM